MSKVETKEEGVDTRKMYSKTVIVPSRMKIAKCSWCEKTNLCLRVRIFGKDINDVGYDSFHWRCENHISPKATVADSVNYEEEITEAQNEYFLNIKKCLLTPNLTDEERTQLKDKAHRGLERLRKEK